MSQRSYGQTPVAPTAPVAAPVEPAVNSMPVAAEPIGSGNGGYSAPTAPVAEPVQTDPTTYGEDIPF